MAALGGKKAEDKGAAEVVTDLWELCRDYAKQETVEPLKAIVQLLKWGLAGSVLLSLGLGFGALAVLRGLQTVTGDSLDGNFDFVPYLAALVFTAGAVALAISAIKRPFRAEEKQQ